MNFRLRPTHSVLLMSQRDDAPYADRVEGNGSVIIYEGQDWPRTAALGDPKDEDQPLRTESGRLTQNGLFFGAARSRPGEEVVRVYEKMIPGTWVFNGHFLLTGAWTEPSNGGRLVWKFRLEATAPSGIALPHQEREPSRMIPSAVKREVWARDGGACVICGKTTELHFDHDVPFSRGGASDVANVRLLCARHNLEKGARIE